MVSVLDSAGLGSSSKDQALGIGLIIQITHCANCPQRQTHIEHTDSRVANIGSCQVVWEWPGTEKLAKRMCKRHNEAPFLQKLWCFMGLYLQWNPSKGKFIPWWLELIKNLRPDQITQNWDFWQFRCFTGRFLMLFASANPTSEKQGTNKMGLTLICCCCFFFKVHMVPFQPKPPGRSGPTYFPPFLICWRVRWASSLWKISTSSAT